MRWRRRAAMDGHACRSTTPGASRPATALAASAHTRQGDRRGRRRQEPTAPPAAPDGLRSRLAPQAALLRVIPGGLTRVRRSRATPPSSARQPNLKILESTAEAVFGRCKVLTSSQAAREQDKREAEGRREGRGPGWGGEELGAGRYVATWAPEAPASSPWLSTVRQAAAIKARAGGCGLLSRSLTKDSRRAQSPM